MLSSNNHNKQQLFQLRIIIKSGHQLLFSFHFTYFGVQNVVLLSSRLPGSAQRTLYGPGTLNIYGLGGKDTLNVQWNGTNETASAPAIWEVQHTH